MYNYHNRKKFIWSILLIMLLVIGIGYAYLTSNLSIAGNTNVSTNTWNIHFENLNVTTGSVTASTAASINAAGDAITYTVNLNRPKEYYEFTVDVKNDGTLPGKVSLSTLSGLDTTSSKIIDYTIAYTSGSPVNVGDILNAGKKRTIKVRVFYKDEIDPEDFPADDLALTLTYTLQYVQSEEDALDTNALIEQLKTNNSSCMYHYTGAVTDQVGVTKTNAENVYYNRCVDKRNIKFGGYCWQMIRTTETGGIKMIYNGEPDSNGECGSSRGTHKGIVLSSYASQNIASSYLYGTSFTYDTSTNEFTLVDTSTATWSDSTSENLIGKYTCKSASNKCTTIYGINSYVSNTNAYVSYYTIADTNYAQIGTTSFNVNGSGPAMVGYMFNKAYSVTQESLTSGYLTGYDVSYSNGTYTLLPASGESELGTALDDTHHYTCKSTSSTCSKVRYYIIKNTYFANYIELDGAANIEAAVNEMLYNDDVNTHNSAIKGIVDSWYAKNLSINTSMLEDTVFCNARNMTNQNTNAWNKDGSLNTGMVFKNKTLNNDLSCANVTDQFAVSNNKAKLTYPVGLATHEELYTLTDNNTLYNSLTNTGFSWWGISPNSFSSQAYVRYVLTSGNVDFSYTTSGVTNGCGARPVVSLKPGTVITEGDGSETDPWVIE